MEHQNPEFVVLPRFWIAEKEAAKFIEERKWLLTYKDVTSPTNQRTMIAAILPRVGLMNSAPFIKTADLSVRHQCCLLGNLNSLPYDYIARQKVGGLHLNFFIVEQLPAFAPDYYSEKCPWDRKTTLEKWISDRVLKLTCTANDMLPLAEAAAFKPGVQKWKEDERDKLRAELDAAYFILYGMARPDVEYILGTFQGIVKADEANGGIGDTRRLILEAFDSMSI